MFNKKLVRPLIVISLLTQAINIPILGSELSSDLTIYNQASSEMKSEVDSQVEFEVIEDVESEIINDVESEVAEDVESEIANDVESEVADEVESEIADEVVITEVIEDVIEDRPTIKEVVSFTTSLDDYSGWVDQRISGNGKRIEYRNGNKNREVTYKNDIMTVQTWFYSNGKRRTQREYRHNQDTGKYITVKEYLYDSSGRTTDYKKWNPSGYLEADYDYYSTGRVRFKTLFFKNGNIKETYRYNSSTVINDRKTYFSSGALRADYNYNSAGIVSLYQTFYSNGIKEFYKQYDSNGNVSRETRFNKYKVRNRVQEFYPDGTIKNRYYYHPNQTMRRSEQFYSDGVRSRYETWTSEGIRTDFKSYYSNGNINADFDYYSTGRQQQRVYSYGSGELKRLVKYYGSGKTASDINYYLNGKVSSDTSYYSNGNMNTRKEYNSSGKYTYYKSYYSNGRLYREYPNYYPNGKAILRFTYTYHSNGIVSKIQRTDYTARGESSTITETYNTSGRQIAESLSSPNANSYFKSPMRSSGAYITCQYGCYNGHTGIDFGNVNKTVPLYSTASGTVIQASGGCSATGGYIGNSCNYGAGNNVVIKHQINGRQYFSIYMHMSAVNVKVGQKVTANTQIGNMGNSGNTSGPHLHFELFEDTDYDGLRSDELRTSPSIHVDLSEINIRIY